MDSARAFALIEASQVAVLTTIRSDGRPRPVPVVFAMLDDRRIISAVDHKPKSTSRLRRLADIERDERVGLLWQHYEDDWDRLWWVRMDGVARVLTDPTPEMRSRMQLRYHHYEYTPPQGPWIEVTPEKLVGWP